MTPALEPMPTRALHRMGLTGHKPAASLLNGRIGPRWPFPGDVHRDSGYSWIVAPLTRAARNNHALQQQGHCGHAGVPQDPCGLSQRGLWMHLVFVELHDLVPGFTAYRSAHDVEVVAGARDGYDCRL